MPVSYFYALTDIGLVRKKNEDSILLASVYEEDLDLTVTEQPVNLDGLLAIVADGMGGASGGEFASNIAVQTISSYIKTNLSRDLSTHHIVELIKNAIIQAHRALILETNKQPALTGMGTTVVVAFFTEKYILSAWVGDSRLYRYLNVEKQVIPSFIPAHSIGNLHQITHDHSMVWEQVKMGLMSPEEARLSPMSNVITQSVGDPLQTPKPDSSILPLIPGDIFLLCSDGLSGMISNETIADTFDDLKEESLESIGHQLLLMAKQAGGRDNISLIIVKPEKLSANPVGSDSIKLSITQKAVPVLKTKKKNKKYHLLLITFIVIIIGAGIWAAKSLFVSEKKGAIPMMVDSIYFKPVDSSVSPQKQVDSTMMDSLGRSPFEHSKKQSIK